VTRLRVGALPNGTNMTATIEPSDWLIMLPFSATKRVQCSLKWLRCDGLDNPSSNKHMEACLSSHIEKCNGGGE
jgi:hypothetical protein